MTTRPTQDIKKSLCKKGFATHSTHHEMLWLYVGDKKTSIRTRISHGESEYDDGLLGLMARQVRLSKKELLSLIDCPLEKEGYADLLIERGIVRLSAEPDKPAGSQ